MVYMSVQQQTDSQLQLLREPTLLSKAVFVGFLVGIIGVFFFGSESFFFKVVIGLCAAGLSCFIVDNYEICEFDKEKSEVRLIRMHWCQFLLNKLFSLGPQPYVIAKLDSIKDVRVEEQGGNNSGKAYQVILSLDTGSQLGVTEVFTTDDFQQHELVACQIRSFLDKDSSFKPSDGADVSEESISSDEDDFEQISPADLEDLEPPKESGDATVLEEEKCENKDLVEGEIDQALS